MTEPTRVTRRSGVHGKMFWCFQLKSPVHGRWIVVSEHLAFDDAKQAQKDYENEDI